MTDQIPDAEIPRIGISPGVAREFLRCRCQLMLAAMLEAARPLERARNDPDSADASLVHEVSKTLRELITHGVAELQKDVSNLIRARGGQ
jgi:hypothetical protein